MAEKNQLKFEILGIVKIVNSKTDKRKKKWGSKRNGFRDLYSYGEHVT